MTTCRRGRMGTHTVPDHRNPRDHFADPDGAKNPSIAAKALPSCALTYAWERGHMPGPSPASRGPRGARFQAQRSIAAVMLLCSFLTQSSNETLTRVLQRTHQDG